MNTLFDLTACVSDAVLPRFGGKWIPPSRHRWKARWTSARPRSPGTVAWHGRLARRHGTPSGRAQSRHRPPARLAGLLSVTPPGPAASCGAARPEEGSAGPDRRTPGSVFFGAGVTVRRVPPVITVNRVKFYTEARVSPHPPSEVRKDPAKLRQLGSFIPFRAYFRASLPPSAAPLRPALPRRSPCPFAFSRSPLCF